MAPVVHTGAGNVTTATSDSANSLIADRPSNVANGEGLIAYVLFRNGGATITPPSGWVQLGFSDFNASWGVYFKEISDVGSEPSTYEFTTAGAGSSRSTLMIARITGADATTLLDVEGADSGNNNQTSVTAPSLDAVAANCLLLMVIHGHKSGSTAPGVTPDAAMTEVAELSAGTTSTSTTQLSQEALTSIGATGTRTAGYDPVADNGVSFLITIKPGSTDATATPSTIAATSSAPAPAVSTGSTASPTSAAATATVPAPTAGASSTATPGTIAAAAAIPQPSVSVDENATAEPAVVAVAATIPAPAIATDVTLEPSAIQAAAAIPTPDTLTVTLATPATIAALAATPAPSPSASSTATPALIAATASIPAAAPLTGIDITATAAGPPRRQWAARLPRRGWDLGVPRRKWTAGPPRTTE